MSSRGGSRGIFPSKCLRVLKSGNPKKCDLSPLKKQKVSAHQMFMFSCYCGAVNGLDSGGNCVVMPIAPSFHLKQPENDFLEHLPSSLIFFSNPLHKIWTLFVWLPLLNTQLSLIWWFKWMRIFTVTHLFVLFLIDLLQVSSFKAQIKLRKAYYLFFQCPIRGVQNHPPFN